METECPRGTVVARLNPFAFPSDTSFRLGLLLAFILSGTVEFAGYIWSALQSAQNHALEACVTAASSQLAEALFSSVQTGQVSSASTRAISTMGPCLSMLRPKAIWSLAAILITTAATLIIYSAIPAIKRYRHRLVPVTDCASPELSAELRRLCEQAQLHRLPAFVWNPLATGQPLAFGSWGRNYLCLSGGFVVHSFFGDRRAFRAIVLHELAHIRNGDVAKAYLAIAASAAFILTSLIPAVVSWIISDSRLVDSLELLLTTVQWTAIIFLSGLAVLRSREYYADLRASVWEGATGAIEDVLGRPLVSARRSWRRYLAFHPDPADRRRVVADPSILFKVGLWDAFGVGLASWSVLGSVNNLLLGYMPMSPLGAFLFFGGLTLVTPILSITFSVAVLGISVWRAAFASLVMGADPYRGIATVGLAMTGGHLLINSIFGFLVLIRSADAPLPALFPLLAMSADLVTIPAGVLVFKWLAAAATTWTPVTLCSRSPVPAIAASILVAIVLLAGAFGSATVGVGVALLFIKMPAFKGELYSYALVVGIPLSTGTLVAWSFPFSASFWSTHNFKIHAKNWAFLGSRASPLPHQEPLRLRSAAMVGMAAGLVSCVLEGGLYFRQHLPELIGESLLAGYLFLDQLTYDRFGSHGMIFPLSAALAQALAAGVAAGRARRLSSLCGLFASSVAALVIGLFDGVLLGLVIRIGVVSSIVSSTLFGVCVAFPISILVPLGGAGIRRMRRRMIGMVPGIRTGG